MRCWDRAAPLVLALPTGQALGFVHEQMATDRRFRVLDTVDDVNRECQDAALDTSISGKRVVGERTGRIARRSRSGMIVSNNGSELTSGTASR